NGDFRHILCTRQISNDCLVSLASGERTYLFPLFHNPDQNTLLYNTGQDSNLAHKFLTILAARIGRSRKTLCTTMKGLILKKPLTMCIRYFIAKTIAVVTLSFCELTFPAF